MTKKAYHFHLAHASKPHLLACLALHITLIWAILSGPIFWLVWVKGNVKRHIAHGAHKNSCAFVVGLGMRLIRGKHCLSRVGRTEL